MRLQSGRCTTLVWRLGTLFGHDADLHPTNRSMSSMAVNPIYHVVHCSDLEWGTVGGIRRYHMEQQGFSDIGYHYVIENGRAQKDALYRVQEDGKLFLGRPINEAGAHVRGYNREAIGTCQVGVRPTVNQLVALRAHHLSLLRYHTALVLRGHYELDSGKTCPYFNVDKLRFYLPRPWTPQILADMMKM